MKTGIILLARLGSTRLAGKVLLEVCGKPILEHIIWRLTKIKPCDEIIVATTVDKKDDAIVKLCDRLGISVFRGSEDNVLERCIGASEAHRLDVVIRLGADTPFIDREIINDMLRIFFEEEKKGNHIEYMSNNLERTFPVGLDSEIFTQRLFKRLDEITKQLSKEERLLNEVNVVPYLHQNQDKFRVFSYKNSTDYSHLRWTLDTPEDFTLIKNVYEALYPKKPDFLMRDILELLNEHPDWAEINSKIMPRSGYWSAAERSRLKRRQERSA